MEILGITLWEDRCVSSLKWEGRHLCATELDAGAGEAAWEKTQKRLGQSKFTWKDSGIALSIHMCVAFNGVSVWNRYRAGKCPKGHVEIPSLTQACCLKNSAYLTIGSFFLVPFK